MSNEMEDEQSDSESKRAAPLGADRVSRRLAPVALLVAVVAVGLAVWALIAASSGASPGVASPPVSDEADPADNQQAGDPRVGVCTAFDTVSRAVSGQTNTDLGADPVAQAAVAGNARLALVGGGQYLLGHLGSTTPTDLADAVRSFGNDLSYIGINALAGVPYSDPDLASRLAQADETRIRIVELCR